MPVLPTADVRLPPKQQQTPTFRTFDRPMTVPKSCRWFTINPAAGTGTNQSFETDLSNGAFCQEQTFAVLI